MTIHDGVVRGLSPSIVVLVTYQNVTRAAHLSSLSGEEKVMREVHSGECALVREVLDRHRERLLALGGVHRIGIGFKTVGGQMTDELAIRLYVADKVPLQRLAPADRSPEEIERIPVDVVVTRPGKRVA